MLFWASVFNGLLAPPSVLLVILLTRNPEIMGDRVNKWWMNWCGWFVLVVITAAAIAMLVTFVS